MPSTEYFDFLPIMYCSVYNDTAAVYLKNTVFKFWKGKEANELAEGEQPYSIDEESRTVIRENVVASIIQSPLNIR